MTESAGERGKGDRAQLTMALLLAGILLAVVLVVNWISPPETVVSVQQFQRLLHDGVVERIGICGDGLRCRLERPVRLVDDGRSQVSQLVLVMGARPSGGDINGWKAAGIAVGPEEQGESEDEQWLGLLLVLGLLGLGVGYLWLQAKNYRRVGSPRQRLLELEKEYQDEKIPLEEYQQRCEAIMAEM